MSDGTDLAFPFSCYSTQTGASWNNPHSGSGPVLGGTITLSSAGAISGLDLDYGLGPPSVWDGEYPELYQNGTPTWSQTVFSSTYGAFWGWANTTVTCTLSNSVALPTGITPLGYSTANADAGLIVQNWNDGSTNHGEGGYSWSEAGAIPAMYFPDHSHCYGGAGWSTSTGTGGIFWGWPVISEGVTGHIPVGNVVQPNLITNIGQFRITRTTSNPDDLKIPILVWIMEMVTPNVAPNSAAFFPKAFKVRVPPFWVWPSALESDTSSWSPAATWNSGAHSGHKFIVTFPSPTYSPTSAWGNLSDQMVAVIDQTPAQWLANNPGYTLSL